MSIFGVEATSFELGVPHRWTTPQGKLLAHEKYYGISLDRTGPQDVAVIVVGDPKSKTRTVLKTGELSGVDILFAIECYRQKIAK